jgi:TP901 family phage tail tape measure protein
MVELSKAGLSVSDTMDATRGVMSLAKAGNIAFADAAVIAASSLNAFGLEGKDATKVADMLAAGANASQANLADLADGMQQSATVAKQFNLSLNENITALSLFANNGIRGSDAGTSLKTMLIALAKPSVAAGKAMKEIGFQAYDAEGKFVGLDEMSKRLKKSTEELTDEQKQNTLATIFGTDAFRAAAVLADNAGESYDNMSKSVGKTGAAQDAARAQMGAYERATEGLSNQLSDLGLSVGTRLLPYVTEATRSFASFIGTLNAGLPGAIGLFKELFPIIAGTTVGLGAFVIAQNAATVSTKALAIAQGALNLAMRANPIALVVGGAAAIVTAFALTSSQTDRTKDATNRLNSAQNNLKTSTDALKLAQDGLRGSLLSQTGAELAVEQATNRYNEVLKSNNKTSLVARQAAYDLAVAERNLASANEDVKNRTNAKNAAEQDVTNKKEAVKSAESQKREALAATSSAVSNQAAALNDLNVKLGQLNGRRISYTIEGVVSDRESAIKAGYKSGAPFKNAIGTNYSPGGQTLVGENGPELVNLPRGSQVTQAYRTRNELAQEGSGGVTNNLNGTFNFSTAESVNAFFSRIDKTQRLAKMGMAS